MELLRGVSAANNFVLALVPLLSSQLFNSRSRPSGGGVSNAARMQKTDHRHRRLLRACRDRPRGCRAAEKRDELAAPHAGHGLFASRLVCRTLSLPQSGRRVLWTKVNRSESRWQVPVRLGAQCLTQQRPTASGARPSVECFRRTDASAPPAESLPGTKKFFCKSVFHTKATPFMRAEPFLGKFLGEGP